MPVGVGWDILYAYFDYLSNRQSLDFLGDKLKHYLILTYVQTWRYPCSMNIHLHELIYFYSPVNEALNT